MARDVKVSDELANKFTTEKDKNTPYVRWGDGRRSRHHSRPLCADLRHVELKLWARRGGQVRHINHEASRTSNDCYVCEIPPGESLAPQRQLFEETRSIRES